VAKNNTITLYDLQLASGCTISPFVWATKYALAHKGFDIHIVPGGFTGIAERTGGRSERLPAIVDDGEWVLDSWLIAEYLDRKYPDRPTLIGDPGIKPLTEFLEGWLWRTAISPWFAAFIVDYRDRSLAVDHPYVTESRERMLGGRKLEEVSIEGKAKLAQTPPTLEPFRQVLKQNKWLGGEEPNYADYRALAVFLWAASVAATPPLTEDDPLRDWIDRGFDLFPGVGGHPGGLGRHPGMSPLFGLKLKEGDPEPFVKAPVVGGLATRNTGLASTKAETDRITGRETATAQG
jgi:glutathione S-transferase